MDSLEETIRKIQQKYKNKPSILSEQYRKSNDNVHFISTTQQKFVDPRQNLLGEFKPLKDTFR